MKKEVIEIDVKDISDFKKYPFKINNDLNYEDSIYLKKKLLKDICQIVQNIILKLLKII